MDSFHFDDAILNSRNLLPRKGSPETFDVMGLKNFLIRLANEPAMKPCAGVTTQTFRRGTARAEQQSHRFACSAGDASAAW